MTKEKINKIISSLIVLVLMLSILSPTVVSAQIRPYQVNNDSVSDIAEDALKDAVLGCIQDQVVNGLLGAASGALQDYFSGAVGDFFGDGLSGLLGGGSSFSSFTSFGKVPVNESALQKINGAIRSDTASQTAKEVGGSGKPSLDSIGFCLANNTIAALTSATANWINTGFGGNPIFVNNPSRYFGNIADYEFERLLDEIADNLICVNINHNQVRRDLYKNYYAKVNVEIPRCILGEINIDIDSFMAGNFSENGGWDAWLAYTTDPRSNYYGSKLSLNSELNRRISESQTEAKIELDWNNGVQSIRNDEGDITTPGRILESQALTRMNAPVNRLTFADEFDEIMNDLLNQFVNIAIGSD